MNMQNLLNKLSALTTESLTMAGGSHAPADSHLCHTCGDPMSNWKPGDDHECAECADGDPAELDEATMCEVCSEQPCVCESATSDGAQDHGKYTEIHRDGQLEVVQLLEYNRSREQARIEAMSAYQTRLKQDPDFSLEQLESADPTTQKIYVPRLATWWLAGEPVEDLISTTADALAKYHRLKIIKQIRPEHADIGRFRTADQFMVAASGYQLPGDRGKYTEIHRDGQLEVVQLLDKTAAMWWGEGAMWVTALDPQVASAYIAMGPLYVIINRKNNDRYQFWWKRTDADDYMFYNERDREVNPTQLPFYNQLRSIFAPLHPHKMWKTNPDNQAQSEKLDEGMMDKIKDLLVPKLIKLLGADAEQIASEIKQATGGDFTLSKENAIRLVKALGIDKAVEQGQSPQMDEGPGVAIAGNLRGKLIQALYTLGVLGSTGVFGSWFAPVGFLLLMFAGVFFGTAPGQIGVMGNFGNKGKDMSRGFDIHGRPIGGPRELDEATMCEVCGGQPCACGSDQMDPDGSAELARMKQMMAGQMPMAAAPVSGMNVTTNVDSTTGNKTVTVTADGPGAEELMRILGLAGIAVAPAGAMGMAEQLANAPDPVTLDAQTQLVDMSGGPNAPHDQYNSDRARDNSMAIAKNVGGLAAKLQARFVNETRTGQKNRLTRV